MPFLGEDGELRRAECYLWRSGAGAGDAKLRGESLPAKASWPAGKVGGEAGRRAVGARGAAGAQSPARGVRAPRTMAPGRGGDAGTVALAALARKAGAVPAPKPLPARSASERSLGRSAGTSARGRPRGALSAPPRPEPPLPLAAFSPSKFGGGRRTAPLPCFAASQTRAAQRARGEGRLAPTGPATLAANGLDVCPPGGELSPGTFSLAAGACVCEAVAPPARSSRLPSPPLPPASHPPPQHVYSSPRAHSPVRSSLPPVRLNY